MTLQIATADGVLRYFVPSKRNVAKKYLVDLTSFDGSGACSCPHFMCRLEPLLRRKVTPKQAREENLVRLKAGRQLHQIFQCDHILQAREQFCSDVIAAIMEQEKKRQGNTRIA